MRRCLEETVSWRIAETRTNVRFGRVETAFGEDAWAVTQTVHFRASLGLEWWCVINAAAEKNVSSKHSNAIFFEIDCIMGAQLH